MSIVDADGVQVRDIDRDAMRVRHELADMDVKAARSFAIRIFRAIGHDWATIARTMRTVSSVARADAKHPVPDLEEILGRNPHRDVDE